MHTIVYLDQSYVSNMAKARYGFVWDEDEAVFWHSLFDCLKKAVLADKIACPESEFHSAEAQYDNRLEGTIMETVYELSCGLQLNPWKSILESQIEDSAKTFLGQRLEEREWWAVAFKSDPNAPLGSRLENVSGDKWRIDVQFSSPDYAVERERQLKSGFVDGAQELLDRHIGNRPDDLPEALVQSKRSFMDGYIGNLAKQSIERAVREGSGLDGLIGLNNYIRLLDLWGRLRRIGINTDDAGSVMAFAESNELLNSPFCDIFASIYAVMATHYSARKIQKGDFYDMAIVAVTLPYCDIVTADGFVKEILGNILHFDEKYEARVFSAAEADRLELQEFIEGL